MKHNEIIDDKLVKVVCNRTVPGSENNPHRLRDLPEGEQEPFSQWLMGQTRPSPEGIAEEDQDFFYVHDYRRWKAGLEAFDHDMNKVYRKELIDLRRDVMSLLGRPHRGNAWFTEYNFYPPDLLIMTGKELCEKIEIFKGLVEQLENADMTDGK